MSMPRHADEVRAILARAPGWAERAPDVTALGLAGSWAAARARDDSDVDLVVLTTDRGGRRADPGWLADLAGDGAAVARVQDWGPHLTEVRAVLPSGLELEVGLADPVWAATDPVDPGTERVVGDGWVSLHDPAGVLGALAAAVHVRPPADVGATPEVAAALLAAQHPDLAGRPLRHVGGGWDNEMYAIGDLGLAVRLPRRRFGGVSAGHEQRWLPGLARLVDLPVPAPVRTGRPAAGYPYPWGVVPWLPGAPAWRQPVADRTAWAARLADVLTDLHVPAPSDAPPNPFRAGPLADRDDVVRQRLLVPGIPGADRLLAAWDDATAADRWPGPPLWVHGDPHPANLLVEGRRLVGLVDFGDLTSGDPAVDLATAWLTFDAAGRDAFRWRLLARGAVDEATWRRARGWAVAMGTAMVRRPGDPAIGSIGRHAVAALRAEDVA